MKRNDEMTGWFRSRLEHAEMPVEDGFWEQLQQGLNAAGAGIPVVERKRFLLVPYLHRITAVASVLLLLGMASAVFWFLSPKEEIEEAFMQISEFIPETNPGANTPPENISSVHKTASASFARHYGKKPSHSVPVSQNAGEDEEEKVTFTISFTLTQQFTGNPSRENDCGFGRSVSMPLQGGYDSGGAVSGQYSDKSHATSSGSEQFALATNRPKANWALKAGAGTSLSKNGHDSPFTVSVSAERLLTNRLSIETGLTYNYLRSDKQAISSVTTGNTESLTQKIHALSVPLKLNTLLITSGKLDVYASVGGAIEKFVGKDCGKEPLQLSVAAGLGVRYRLNDRIALFAEPAVSRHWSAGNSRMNSLRTERPANLNLLCGIRMTY